MLGLRHADLERQEGVGFLLVQAEASRWPPALRKSAMAAAFSASFRPPPAGNDQDLFGRELSAVIGLHGNARELQVAPARRVADVERLPARGGFHPAT